jgi:hypothetical protein
MRPVLIWKMPCLNARRQIKIGGNLRMKRLLSVCLALVIVGAAKGDEESTSPYATAADFAKYAMKLREQALLKVEPQVFVPTSSRPTTQRFPWKMNIVTTVFWVGEQAGGNNPVPNYRSSWDFNWTTNYGGFDTPDSSARRNYIPVAFIPHQNPFYCALPYNDVTHGQFKPEARSSSRGSSRFTRGLANQCVKIIGSRFAKVTALVTRSGKIAAHFAPTISSMFSKMSGQSRTQSMGRV